MKMVIALLSPCHPPAHGDALLPVHRCILFLRGHCIPDTVQAGVTGKHLDLTFRKDAFLSIFRLSRGLSLSFG